MAIADIKNVSGLPIPPVEVLKDHESCSVGDCVCGAKDCVCGTDVKPLITLKLFNKSPRRFLYERNINDPTKNKYLEPGATVELSEAKAQILLSYPEAVVNTATMVDEKQEMQKLRDELRSKADREKELLDRVSHLESLLNDMAKNTPTERKPDDTNRTERGSKK